MLLKRRASRTTGTKRAILQAFFTVRLATSLETMEKMMLHMEETVRGYDGMFTKPLPDDIQCATMIGICPRDLKECLGMSTEEFVYCELR